MHKSHPAVTTVVLALLFSFTPPFIGCGNRDYFWNFNYVAILEKGEE
jgi:hypothetical protein